jgi:hypothetical protein
MKLLLAASGIISHRCQLLGNARQALISLQSLSHATAAAAAASVPASPKLSEYSMSWPLEYTTENGAAAHKLHGQLNIRNGDAS